MKWIYDLTYEQLKEEITAAGIKKFTVDQVFQWLYQKNVQDIFAWTNISKTNQHILARKFDTSLNKIITKIEDQQGTKKILFELPDQYRIESVLIKEKDHYTFCISTQVGCALNCRFCATGRMGFKRNLTPGEILSQVLSLEKEIPGYTGKLNIVLMGMGEPLLNYENLKQALEIITSEKAIGISPRNITLSTSGILEHLRRFEIDFPRMKISFSLNAPDALIREALMPISRKEQLSEILHYFRATASSRKHRVTFEYVLIRGINDSPDQARLTADLLRGIPCKINLIPYNVNKDLPVDFETPTPEEVELFSDYLHSRGFTVITRWSKGKEIKSACGQLAANAEEEDDDDDDENE
ncbi:MAG TPA: 23S rRNA (adenine(2503)-C(2))-methyltransferase RlmN [Candidatus Kapabacteria bacterium]|nr:23S rRNA (adenine(2503)-C(2))-methyltransferase RlmN [Candidatus Kapabacteria bacterium]